MNAASLRRRVLKYWWFLALCTVLAIFGAVADILVLPPTYVATTRLTLTLPSTVIVATQFVATETSLVSTPAFLSEVAKNLPGISEATLAKEVSASGVSGTQLFDVTVTDKNAARAVLIANTVAEQLVLDVRDTQAQQNLQGHQQMQSAVEQAQAALNASIENVRQLEASGTATPQELAVAKATQDELQLRFINAVQGLVNLDITEAATLYLLRIVRPATTAAVKVKPSRSLVVGLAPVLGLLAGIVGLMASELFVEYLRPLTAAPNEVPWEALGRVKAHPTSTIAIPDDREGFQGIVNALRFLDLAAPARHIAVMGLGRVDAASEVAAGIALATAAAGQRTLLIDAAFPQGSQAQRFGSNAQPGLTEALLEAHERGNEAAPGQYLQSPRTITMPDLRLLTTGNAPTISANVAGAPALGAQVFGLAQRLGAQVSVVDLSAPGRVKEMAQLAAGADAVVVVIDVRAARYIDVTRAADALTAAQTHVVGYVVVESGATSNATSANDASRVGKIARTVAP